MDGTIVDSGACVERQWARWASRYGIPMNDVLAVSHGRRTIETMRLLVPQVDHMAEAREFLAGEAADLEGIRPFEGAGALMASLPIDRWAVVTSSSENVARVRLRHCGFPEPQVLVTADHVRNGKPHPEPWLTAARLLGLEPARCLVIEDANSGIRGAVAAGMQVIGVGWAREALECEHRIESFAELRVEIDDGAVRVSKQY